MGYCSACNLYVTMKLIGISGRACTVLLAGEVVTELNDWGSAKHPKNAMVSLLTKSVPDHGPHLNTEWCSPLGDGIYEFRKGENRGPKVRVLWFYGEKREILVCSSAFVKTFRRCPPEEIANAKIMRNRYEEAVRTEELEIEDGTYLLRRKR